MNQPSALPLFSRLGVELEYMVVDRHSLDVRGVVDKLFHSVAGEYAGEIEHDDITWSNELVSHVLELKCAEPARSLVGLDAQLVAHVRQLNELLAPHGAMLLPTAMHPWMNPLTEAQLWAHDYNEVYAAFDRLFDCRGHGWSNLQSAHLNLPFAGDDEFGRLHAAIRLVLPLLPGLAASSPLADGHPTGFCDTRLEYYRKNSARIASITAQVVPEPVFTRREYQSQILDVIYRELTPHDPGGILRDEWVNARGAIARFSRGTIEIRVLDVQECPQADLGILSAGIADLRALVSERFTSLAQQQRWPTEPLAQLLRTAIAEGDQTSVDDAGLLRQFGVAGRERLSLGELWRHLVETTLDSESADLYKPAEARHALEVILQHGPLSRRILKATGTAPSRETLREVYGELAQCLAEDRMFVP